MVYPLFNRKNEIAGIWWEIFMLLCFAAFTLIITLFEKSDLAFMIVQVLAIMSIIITIIILWKTRKNRYFKALHNI